MIPIKMCYVLCVPRVNEYLFVGQPFTCFKRRVPLNTYTTEKINRHRNKLHLTSKTHNPHPIIDQVHKQDTTFKNS